MSHFQVEFLGRENPCRDRDASAVRLRTHRGQEYFQFFLGLIPGSAMASLDPAPDDDWWRAFVLLAAREVEQQVRGGFTPAADPIMAVTVVVDANEVLSMSRSTEALSSLDPSEQYVAGPVIHDFTL